MAHATTELQELLALTLRQRGYDLGNAAVVELLKPNPNPNPTLPLTLILTLSP